MTAQSQIISQKDKKLAQKLLAELSKDNIDRKSIPPKAMQLFVEIIQNMADGKPVAVIPTESELSTQDAANHLQVSRTHIVKLLEQGKIPFRKAGTHRRIKLIDLLNYEASINNERTNQLGFLAKQAQELKMGYE